MHSQLFALVLIVAMAAIGIGDFERGNRLYRDGRFEEAVTAYQAALADGEAAPELHYNLGTALLRLGRYEEADRQFEAALRTVEPELRQRTFYNLGNRYLRAARQSDGGDARAGLLDAAVDAYKQALRLAPDDADAKWNLELALDEREQPPSQSSSDGQQQPQQSGGRSDGQGGGDEPDPMGSPSGGGERMRPPGSPQRGAMSQEQAARILSAIAEDERELYRDQLQKGQRETPVAKDW